MDPYNGNGTVLNKFSYLKICTSKSNMYSCRHTNTTISQRRVISSTLFLDFIVYCALNRVGVADTSPLSGKEAFEKGSSSFLWATCDFIREASHGRGPMSGNVRDTLHAWWQHLNFELPLLGVTPKIIQQSEDRGLGTCTYRCRWCADENCARGSLNDLENSTTMTTFSNEAELEFRQVGRPSPHKKCDRPKLLHHNR